MNKTELHNEFSSLVIDVKEQLLYLKELGLETIDADFPELKLNTKLTVSNENDFVPADKLEQFIKSSLKPKANEINRESDKNKTQRRRRRGIFDSTKLSRMPSLKKIGSQPTEIPNRKPPAPPKEEPMAKETKQKDSVFEDVTIALPESTETLAQIHTEIGKDCKLCKLCEKRTQVVNSVGDPNADLMFIGEAPGADEDEQGEPFVGRAGKLLTKIIGAINFKREDVFIGNINRCRPPGNRQPQADEAKVCRPFLLREISVVRPKVIVVMGNTACQNLLGTKTGITKLRGTFQDYFGVKVMPTFHPAYLLRDPRKKREVWEDLKTVRDYLNQSK